MTLMADTKVLEFLGIKVGRKMGALIPAPAIRFQTVAAFKERLGLDDEQTTHLTGMQRRTYQRRKASGGALTHSEADATLRSARVAREALTTFGDQARATAWLKTPNAFLGAAPIDLMSSDAGARAVEQELVRIHWGDYA